MTNKMFFVFFFVSRYETGNIIYIPQIKSLFPEKLHYENLCKNSAKFYGHPKIASQFIYHRIKQRIIGHFEWFITYNG